VGGSANLLFGGAAFPVFCIRTRVIFIRVPAQPDRGGPMRFQTRSSQEGATGATNSITQVFSAPSLPEPWRTPTILLRTAPWVWFCAAHSSESRGIRSMEYSRSLRCAKSHEIAWDGSPYHQIIANRIPGLQLHCESADTYTKSRSQLLLTGNTKPQIARPHCGVRAFELSLIRSG
jgi:hypothetical protein